jgi:hypothetical protein
VLRQCGVFREPTTLSGRLLLFLNHPVTILGALLSRRTSGSRRRPASSPPPA